ncbi:VWA domain-containing protein [Imhoffiella purpurea]|nr:vWA domain-containing protein [Imhoffiella purpurea]
MRLLPILFLALGTPAAVASVDVMLALDRSLSMASNDPDRDSLKGVEVFSALLKPDDELGIITFAETAELGVAGRDMAEADARTDIDAFLREVVMDGKRTNFGAALRLGYETFAHQDVKFGAERFLVLFTDGQLNLGAEAATQAARRAIFDELLPLYRSAGIRIFGLAFSSEADLDFLGRLADSTNGRAFRAEKAEDLYAAFVQLFEQLDIPLTTPIAGDQIQVDENVKGLELLVKRGPDGGQMRLIDPVNQTLTVADGRSGVEWQSFDDFDHIRIQDPQPGTWRLATSSTDSKAYIESDLDLEAEIPPRVRAGEGVTVEARLVNHDPDGDSALIEGARLEARIQSASGWEQPPISFESVSMDDDAHDFRGTLLFTSMGDARVELTARGRGFRRTKHYPIEVAAAVSALDSVPANDQDPKAKGGEPIPATPPEQSAAVTLLFANALILALLALILGAWWWRRCRMADRDESDLDV